MVRNLHWVLILASLGLLACTVESDDSGAQQSDSGAGETSWRDQYLALGRETYESACASCHDETSNGAPVKGDRESWANRSPLWSAVLFEHAKNGYLDMPAKGGHLELTDKAVEAAGEYMLSETFPEYPRD